MQDDAAEAFQPVEEALELLALFVELPVDWGFVGAARIGLDLCASPEVVVDGVTDTLQAG